MSRAKPKPISLALKGGDALGQRSTVDLAAMFHDAPPGEAKPLR